MVTRRPAAAPAHCPVKGALGDALHAVLCGCGHDIRLILARLTDLVAVILALILGKFASATARIRRQKSQITAQA